MKSNYIFLNFFTKIYISRYQFNTISNPIIFYQLYLVDYNIYLNRGKILINDRDRKIKELLPFRGLYQLDKAKCFGV